LSETSFASEAAGSAEAGTTTATRTKQRRHLAEDNFFSNQVSCPFVRATTNDYLLALLYVGSFCWRHFVNSGVGGDRDGNADAELIALIADIVNATYDHPCLFRQLRHDDNCLGVKPSSFRVRLTSHKSEGIGFNISLRARLAPLNAGLICQDDRSGESLLAETGFNDDSVALDLADSSRSKWHATDETTKTAWSTGTTTSKLRLLSQQTTDEPSSNQRQSYSNSLHATSPPADFCLDFSSHAEKACVHLLCSG
jgi:hypothetical protein